MRDKILIVPDVHGRKFWKEDTGKLIDYIDHEVIDVVFLGDYVDPYPFEGIKVGDAIENLNDIIEFAKSRQNVHLLLGNHDMHYFDNYYAKHVETKVRYSYEHAKKIAKIFKSNKNLFNIAWETRVNDKKLLFTHAGVLKTWAEIHMGNVKTWRGCIDDKHKIPSIEPNAKSLNALLDTHDGILALADVPQTRGGWCAYGSPIWCDFIEHIESLEYNAPGKSTPYNYKDEVYQVFGHSLGWPFNDIKSLDTCYIGPYFAMLDARTSFLVDDDGSIHEISDNMERFREDIGEIYCKKDA